jgi:hypothetical protein
VNTDIQAIIKSETHRRGAARRASGVWRQSPLAVARWDDWSMADEDLRHPLDAPRQRRDNIPVDQLRKAVALRPALLIRRRARAGASLAEIAAEVGLPESVVRAVLDSPLTRALTVLEGADGNA